MSTFLIACGGTGGHLSPGIALAEALVERGHAATLLISLKKVDARLSEKYPRLTFERVPSAPLGWSPGKFARFAWDQARGLAHCRRLVARLKPEVIIGFGGFTNAGVVLAGRMAGVPVALHEANRVPGRATRLLSRMARRLYLPPGVRLPGRLGLMVRHTGLPVRREIVRLSRHDARTQLGVDPNQKLVVVLGGSQGAGPLNRWVEESAAALAQEGVQVWCVTGMGKGEIDVREFPGRNGQTVRVWREPFCDRMGVLISAADVAISRAGAGTLAELVRCETPAVLVPYPFAADNHQQANAAYFEQQGGGLVVAETALAGLKLEIIDMVFNDWLLDKFRTNLRRMEQESSIEVIVHDLEALASGQTPGRQIRPAPAASVV